MKRSISLAAVFMAGILLCGCARTGDAPAAASAISDDSIEITQYEGLSIQQVSAADYPDLEADLAELNAETVMQEEAMDALKSCTTVKVWPQEQIDSAKAAYLEAYPEESQDTAEEYAENAVEEEMIISAIAEAEDLAVTEDWYQEHLEEYAAKYFYEDGEALTAAFTQEEIMRTMERERVLDFVVENADPAEETDTAAGTGSEDGHLGLLLYLCAGMAILLLIVLIALLIRLLREGKR